MKDKAEVERRNLKNQSPLPKARAGFQNLISLRSGGRWQLPAPTEDVAPRLIDDIQLLAGEGFRGWRFGNAVC